VTAVATERSKLVIVGDSLFAEIAHEYFTHDSPYEVVAFAVERGFARHTELFGLPVVDFEELEAEYPPTEHLIYCALTYAMLNRLRTRLANAAKDKGYALASYVSSSAFVAKSAAIGEHCFIFEDNTVQPFVTIEDNAVLWSGNHIGHHSTISRNCFVSSHVVVSGSCEIGENCFLGVNSTLVNDISIGRDTWIGPHVVVTRDVEPASFLRPARSDLSERSSFEVLGVEPDG
jgi:sugar O-acyltransferase (sialic acid O-acetyltransferase NeuD family)